MLCQVSGIWNCNLLPWISDICSNRYPLVDAECYNGPLFCSTLAFAWYRYTFRRLDTNAIRHMSSQFSFLMDNLLAGRQPLVFVVYSYIWLANQASVIFGNLIGAQTLKLIIQPWFISSQHNLIDEEDDSLIQEVASDRRFDCRRLWIKDMQYNIPKFLNSLVSSRTVYAEILPSALAIVASERNSQKRHCK